MPPTDSVSNKPLRRLAPVFIVALAAPLAGGCDSHGATPKTTQVVARVNGDEITYSEVNHGLRETGRGGPDAAAPQARRFAPQVLEGLIDEELLVQAARQDRLDRDPDILDGLEAARRKVLAKAYTDKLGENVAAPSTAAIHAYFTAHPMLFADRRVYTLRELRVPRDSVEVPPGNDADGDVRTLLRLAWERTHQWSAVAEKLQAMSDHHVIRAETELAAEQLPLDQLGTLHEMREGEARFFYEGATVVAQQLVKSVAAPVDEAHAREMIGDYLQAQAREAAASAELARLHGAANIERLADFATAPVANPSHARP